MITYITASKYCIQLCFTKKILECSKFLLMCLVYQLYYYTMQFSIVCLFSLFSFYYFLQVPPYVLTIKYIAVFIAYMNSALNPILYAGFNENFRKGFKEAFRCHLLTKENKVTPGIHMYMYVRKNGTIQFA